MDVRADALEESDEAVAVDDGLEELVDDEAEAVIEAPREREGEAVALVEQGNAGRIEFVVVRHQVLDPTLLQPVLGDDLVDELGLGLGALVVEADVEAEDDVMPLGNQSEKDEDL